MFHALAIALLFGVAVAFPTGAPEWVCTSMKPLHLFGEDKSAPRPFLLNISSTSYEPGDIITGTLRGNGNFRGFLIEGRRASSKQEGAIGEFIDFDNDLAQNTCGKSAITHKNNNDKEEINFSWKAPATGMGDLIFRATVVEYYRPFSFSGRYWQGIYSDILMSGQ